MTSYVTPKKNVAFKFYIGLVDQSNTKLLKAAPTIAAGDFKVSIDGGAFANLATLPSANPASGRAIMVDFSTSEMNGDNIVFQAVDAAGAEWCDLLLNIQTTAQQIDDIPTAIQNADGLLNRDMATGTDSGSSTVRTVRNALRVLRNKTASASGTLTVYKEDDTASAWTATLTTDNAAVPIITIDPAG